MKRILICFITMVSLILVGYGSSYALQGPCVACHTMHNSQNNSAMNFDLSTTPNPILLRGTCLGCHARNVNTRIYQGYVPQVRHTDGTGDLAGGNFGYLFNSPAVDPLDAVAVANKYTVGHNVIDFVTVPEGTLTVPPGDQNSTGITNLNFTCAGQFGCHGDRTVSGSMAGISGSHHANAVGSINTPTSSGQSYRFLKGVKGFEDTRWEDITSTTTHNVYFGVIFGSAAESTKTTPGAATISGLCGECHGLFHGPTVGEVRSATQWLRHPTDAILPGTAGSEYNSYRGANLALVYDTRAPIGKPAAPVAPVAIVVPGTDVVTCLSCHKAHASANADILRWNYEDIVTGGGQEYARCFVCHTNKDNAPNL